MKNIFLLTSAAFLLALTASLAGLETNKEERLNAIEKEMEQITKDIRHCRLKTMHDEVESGDYRNTDLWGHYVEDIENAEDCSRKINKLKKRYKELEVERERIRYAPDFHKE